VSSPLSWRNHAAFEDGEIVISIGFFPAFSFHFFFRVGVVLNLVLQAFAAVLG